MRNLMIVTGVCFMLIAISLILPYEIHDRTSGGWFTASTIEEKNIITSGIEVLGSSFALFSILGTSCIVLIKRNLATAIIGFLLFSFVVFFVFLGYLEFSILNFELEIFSNKTNSKLMIGYYVLFFAVFAYLILLLVNMISVARMRNIKKRDQLDLLDDLNI